MKRTALIKTFIMISNLKQIVINGETGTPNSKWFFVFVQPCKQTAFQVSSTVV